MESKKTTWNLSLLPLKLLEKVPSDIEVKPKQQTKVDFLIHKILTFGVNPVLFVGKFGKLET